MAYIAPWEFRGGNKLLQYEKVNTDNMAWQQSDPLRLRVHESRAGLFPLTKN